MKRLIARIVLGILIGVPSLGIVAGIVYATVLDWRSIIVFGGPIMFMLLFIWAKKNSE